MCSDGDGVPSVTWRAVRIAEAWCHLSHVATRGSELSPRALQCVLEWLKSSSIEWEALLVVESSLREIFEIQKDVRCGALLPSVARNRLEGLLHGISAAVNESDPDPAYDVGGYKALSITPPPDTMEAFTIAGRVQCIDVAAIGVFLKTTAQETEVYRRMVDLRSIRSISAGSLHQHVVRVLNL